MNARALLFLLPLLPLAAAAQPVPLRTLDRGELGVQVMRLRYEAGSDSNTTTQEGNKVGLTVGFTQALGQDWYWGADAQQSYGNSSYSSASHGDKGGNDEVLTEVRVIGGKDYPLSTRQLLAPYFGLGLRRLDTDRRGLTSTGDAGYRQRSQYVYLPLGLTHRLQLGPEARLATSLEYDLLLDGRQRFYLSDTNASSDDPATSQRNGHGLRLSSGYETHYWSLVVFIHYWRIGASDQARQSLAGVPGVLVQEPASSTSEAGVQFRLHFK